jgi:hypothetical protein
MGHRHNQYEQGVIADLVHHSVVADPDAIVGWRTAQFLAAGGTRFRY